MCGCEAGSNDDDQLAEIQNRKSMKVALKATNSDSDEDIDHSVPASSASGSNVDGDDPVSSSGPSTERPTTPVSPLPVSEVLVLPPGSLPPPSVTDSTPVTALYTVGFVTESCPVAPTADSPMTYEPANPPSDFSGTTTKPPTRTVTTAYNAPGQQGLQQLVCTTTTTQGVNQNAALRACCSSPHLQGNYTTTGSKSGLITGSAPPLRDIPLNKSRTCQWPSPGNASAPAPNTTKPGHDLTRHPAGTYTW
ncbi:hypothetical protein HPB51_008649 [Rhipicephalus microplus]|uniref:Uncharacterized protein n=1 Tax=Rhipicephalus microplus TaxID=6941 RepID=A0A9J6EG34_RHIMP|nr:hypothetical protein HPB51_008649 [Rhipicephalus microplus]